MTTKTKEATTRTTTTTTTTTTSTSTSTSSSMTILDKEKIFLFNFAPVPHVYSVCPFAIKLESFLRINHISYTPIYSPSKFSKKGQMPYIKLNDVDVGEEIPDSNTIIQQIQYELEEKMMMKQQRRGGGGDDADDDDDDSHVYYSEHTLTSFQKSMTHMLIRMLEEHTIQLNFYYRYGLNMETFVDKLDIEQRFRPGSAKMWKKIQPDATKNKLKYRGLLKHTNDELWKFCNDDLQSIENVLRESNEKGNMKNDDKTNVAGQEEEPKQSYVFGTDQPTLADCAIFGHVSQFIWIPIDFPQKAYIYDNCPSLIAFMNRFRDQIWPDWDELCNTKVEYPSPPATSIRRHRRRHQHSKKNKTKLKKSKRRKMAFDKNKKNKKYAMKRKEIVSKYYYYYYYYFPLPKLIREQKINTEYSTP